MSFETSFDSKKPKLEPKLVSALSETKRLFRLFRLFRFYTETESFGVSIEPKQTEENVGLFRSVSVCYETVLFVSVVSIYCGFHGGTTSHSIVVAYRIPQS